MRDLARINRIQGLIHNIWLNYPDVRYHQLIYGLKSNYFRAKGYNTKNKEDWYADWFYFEDSDWEEFLINFKGFE
jgi:hypothetical protein